MEQTIGESTKTDEKTGVGKKKKILDTGTVGMKTFSNGNREI